MFRIERMVSGLQQWTEQCLWTDATFLVLHFKIQLQGTLIWKGLKTNIHLPLHTVALGWVSIGIGRRLVGDRARVLELSRREGTGLSTGIHLICLRRDLRGLLVMTSRGVVMTPRGVVMTSRGVVMTSRGVVMTSRGVVMTSRGVCYEWPLSVNFTK